MAAGFASSAGNQRLFREFLVALDAGKESILYPAHLGGQPNCDGTTVRVLLAEDEFLLRLDLAESIRSLGWEVVEVSSADEGLELLRHRVVFDLVVTDINMPGHNNGFDLARYARAKCPGITVVILSSEASPAPERSQDFDLFLRKPVWNIAPYLLPLIRKTSSDI
jgi:CheY-like chemotaxis protein